MRTYFIILALAAFGCNSNQQLEKRNEATSNNGKCFTYTVLVDSLQVKDLYDRARWYIYTWHCDEVYLSKRDTLKSVTFGELPLKFNNLTLKHDTVELNFDFIDEFERYPILPSMTRNSTQLLSGVAFNMKTREKLYMVSPGGFSTIIKGGANRFENPLQPEVLAYIKSNWNKLDSCFKELAERKEIKQ